jgi:hypothetical protein
MNSKSLRGAYMIDPVFILAAGCLGPLLLLHLTLAVWSVLTKEANEWQK